MGTDLSGATVFMCKLLVAENVCVAGFRSFRAAATRHFVLARPDEM